VYALQTPSPPPSPEAAALRDFVRDFADLIQAKQPAGPYAVAGFSAAGIVAVAIAEELVARGARTDLVALFDSVPPGSVPVPSPFGSATRLLRLLRTVVGRVWETLSGPNPLARLWSRTRAAVGRGLARWKLTSLPHEPDAGDSFAQAVATLPDAERGRWQRYLEAIWRHAFGPLELDLVLFRVALDPFEGPHEAQLGWQRVTRGAITVEPLRGRHEQVLSAKGAPELAARLAVHLERRAPSPP
jgi:thioesterase domain-containing protein